MQLKLTLAIPASLALFCLPVAAHAQNPTTTTLTVTAAGNPVTSIAAGTVVTLTAAVTSAGSPVRPARVDFCDATTLHCADIHLIGSAQVTSAGTAVMKLVPGSGAHIYRAVFRGTHTSAASSSPASATLSVGSSNVPTILAGGAPGSYSLSTLVTGNGLSPPTGIVNFVDTSNAGYILASASLVPASGTSLSGVRYILSQYVGGIPHSPPSQPGCDITLIPTNCIQTSFAIGDFNGDGNQDVVFGDSALTILLGKGDGTFTMPRPNEPVAGTDAISMAVADFNQDGKLDIVMTQGPSMGISYTYILTGNGDGTFTQGQILTGVGNPHVAVADFNGDGIPDLVLSAGGTIDFGATILLGNGNGTFTAGASYATGVDGPATIADFNGDGTPDLLFTGPGNLLTLLLGNGDGTFRTVPPIPLVALGLPVTVTTGDFNADGILDLAVMNAQQQPIDLTTRPPSRPDALAFQTIFKGKGDGTFTQMSVGPVPVQGGDFEVGDFNGDGIDDLFIAGNPSMIGEDQIMIQFGAGDGSFYTPFPPRLAGFGPAARVADFNNDGLPDIASADLLGVGVLLNQPASFSATATVSGVNIVGTGFHLVDATYLGDTFYAGGVSATIPLTALQIPTTLALTANATAINEFQPIVLTATLTLSTTQTQNHTPTGSVTFSSGTTVLGTAPLTGSTATLTTSKLPAGTDSVTASYSGDANFAPSTSGPVTVAVTLVDFTLTPANPTVSLEAQHHTTTTLTLTSLNGFTDSIAIACGKLPTFVTCLPTPTPAPLAANGTTSISLYLDTDVVLGFARNTTPSAPTHPFAPATGFALSLVAGLATLRKGRSRLHLLLLAALAIPMTLALTGCGEIILPPSATLPGTYTIPITATGVSTAITHTVNLTLTVTR